MCSDSELFPFFCGKVVNNRSISLSNKVFNLAVKYVRFKSEAEPMLLVHMPCGKYPSYFDCISAITSGEHFTLINLLSGARRQNHFPTTLNVTNIWY